MQNATILGDSAKVDVNTENFVQNGDIDVSGSSGGSVKIAASKEFKQNANISAKGTDSKGGNIEINAKNITAVSFITTDVSGKTEGGTIKESSTDKIDQEGTLKANCTGESGNGGNIKILAKGDADVKGTIEAKKGSSSGLGGNVEVSSAGKLALNADINTTGGFLTIDPTDINISDADLTFTSTYVEGLLATNNLTLLADNDLTVNTDLSWSNGHSLTLDSGRNVAINANINSAVGDLSVIANDVSNPFLNMANRTLGTGSITTASGKTINTGSGSLSFLTKTDLAYSGDDIVINSNINTNNFTVTNNETGKNISITGNLQATGKTTLTANDISISNTAYSYGGFDIEASRSVTTSDLTTADATHLGSDVTITANYLTGDLDGTFIKTGNINAGTNPINGGVVHIYLNGINNSTKGTIEIGDITAGDASGVNGVEIGNYVYSPTSEISINSIHTPSSVFLDGAYTHNIVLKNASSDYNFKIYSGGNISIGDLTVAKATSNAVILFGNLNTISGLDASIVTGNITADSGPVIITMMDNNNVANIKVGTINAAGGMQIKNQDTSVGSNLTLLGDLVSPGTVSIWSNDTINVNNTKIAAASIESSSKIIGDTLNLVTDSLDIGLTQKGTVTNLGFQTYTPTNKITNSQISYLFDNINITNLNLGSASQIGDIGETPTTSIDFGNTTVSATTQGNIYLNAANNLNIDTLTAGKSSALSAVKNISIANDSTTNGNFDITAGQDINFNGAFATGGGVLTANAGQDINVSNNITTGGGDVNITANKSSHPNPKGNIKMTNNTTIDAGNGNVSIILASGNPSGNIELGSIKANALNIYNNGLTPGSDIIIDGILTTTGTADTNIASAAGNIEFTNSVSTSTYGSSFGGNLYLKTSGGSITLDPKTTLTVGNDLYLQSGIDESTSGLIDLGENNNNTSGIECFGQVYIPWAYNAFVLGLTNLKMGNVNVCHDLHVIAGLLNYIGFPNTYTITQCDGTAIKVKNDTILAVGNSSHPGDIKLNQDNNLGTNGSGQVYIGRAHDATINNTNSIVLGDMDVTHELNISVANGDITQFGGTGINVGADMNLNATLGGISQTTSSTSTPTTMNVGGNTYLVAKNAIKLNQSGNDFNSKSAIGQLYINRPGSSPTKAASALITDQNGINLGDINTAGSLGVTAKNGDIVQGASTAINVDTSMNLTATGNISQAIPTGTETLPAINVGTTATLNAGQDINFNGTFVTRGGILTADAGKDININNNITTNSGNVTMTANIGSHASPDGNITMADNTTLDAGTGDVTLKADGGDVTLCNVTAGSITVDPTNITINSAVVTTGNQTYNATNNITIATTGSVTSNGASSIIDFTAGNAFSVNGSGSVSTTGASSDTKITTTTGNINISSAGSITTAGTATYTSGNDISNLGLIKGSNTTVLTAARDIIVGATTGFIQGTGSASDFNLSAGRTIRINGNILTDGGDLTAIANTNPAHTGTSSITMGSNAKIDTSSIGLGTGDVSLTLDANINSDDITLYAITGNNILVNNKGLTTSPTSDIIMNADIFASGASSFQSTGDININSAGFIHGTGGSSTVAIAADRTVNLNGNIATNNDNVTITANNGTSHPGVLASLKMGSAAKIDAGTGNVTLTLKPNTDSDDITLYAITGKDIVVDNQGLTNSPSSDVIINADIFASGASSFQATGDVIVNSTGFIHGTGATSTVAIAAGKTVDIEGNIATNNRDVAIVANNGTSHPGVLASLKMGTTAKIDAGTGNVALTLNANPDSDDITLYAITGNDIAVANQGSTTTPTTSDIIINSNIFASGASSFSATGDITENATGFIHGTGATSTVAIAADRNVNIRGNIDTSANNKDVIITANNGGYTGPVNITMTNTGNINAGSGGNVSMTLPAKATSGDITLYTVTGNQITINNLGTTPTVSDILINGIITASGNSLFDTIRDVTISSTGSIQGTNAASDFTVNAGRDFNVNGTITTAGGDLTTTDGRSFNISNNITTGGGNVLAHANNGTHVGSLGRIAMATGTNINTGSGNVTLILQPNTDSDGITLNDITANTIDVENKGTTTTPTPSNLTINGILTAAGNAILKATGNITQNASSGGITINGTTDLKAGSSNNIRLEKTTNDFVGAVTIEGGNNASLRDANSFKFGPVTNNGNLTVYANCRTVGGATANISMDPGATINSGGNVDIRLLDHPNGGTIDVNSIDANTILVWDQSLLDGTNVIINGGATLSSHSLIDANPLIVSSDGGNFINNAGTGALSVAADRWLVYTGSPADTTLGGLVPVNTYYSSTIYTRPPATVAPGNSVLYRTPNPGGGGGGGGGGGVIAGGVVGGVAVAGAAASYTGLGLLPGLLIGLASPIQFDETMIDIIADSENEYPMLVRNIQYVYQIGDISSLSPDIIGHAVSTLPQCTCTIGSARFIPDDTIQNGSYELVQVAIPPQLRNAPKGVTAIITQKSCPFCINKNIPDMNFNVFNTLSCKQINAMYQTRRFLKPNYLSKRIAALQNCKIEANNGIIQKTICVGPNETCNNLTIAVNYLKHGEFPRKNCSSKFDKQAYSLVVQFFENK